MQSERSDIALLNRMYSFQAFLLLVLVAIAMAEQQLKANEVEAKDEPRIIRDKRGLYVGTYAPYTYVSYPSPIAYSSYKLPYAYSATYGRSAIHPFFLG